MTVEENIDIPNENSISDNPEISTDYFFNSGERAGLLKDITADIAAHVPVIVLSGEKGQGKSSLCRILVEQIPADCRVIYFEKTVESFEDVVRVIAAKVECGEVDVSRMAMPATIDQIGTRLTELNIRIVVIFDGAEMIYLATMERIRKMLDQLNEPEVRMQAVVSGRPLLLEHMAQLSIVKFREVDEKQYILNPLNESDTGDFIDHLTKLLPATTERPSPEILSHVYQITGGNVAAVVECVETLQSSDDPAKALATLVAGMDQSESVVSRLKSITSIIGERVKDTSRRTLAIGGGVCLVLLLIILILSGEDKQQKVTDDSLPPIEQTRPEQPKEKELVKGKEVKKKEPVQTLDPAKKEVHKGKVEPEFNVAKKPAKKPTVVESPPAPREETIPPPPKPEKEVIAEEVRPAAEPIVVEKEAEKQKPVKETIEVDTAVVVSEAVVDAVQEKESEAVENLPPVPVQPVEKPSSVESKVAYNPPPVQFDVDEPEISLLHADKVKHLIDVDEPGTAPQELKVPFNEIVSEEQKEQVTEALSQKSEELGEEVVLQVLTPNTPPLIVATEKKVTHAFPLEIEPTIETPVVPSPQEIEIPEPVAPPPPAKKILKPVVETAVVAPQIEQSYGSINSGAILASRIEATKPWLTGAKDDKYTIQLLILTSMFAEEKITNILSRREYAQAARNFYVLEREGDTPAYFVYYGEYDDLNEARRAQSTIPLFLRNHRPYVLSVPSAIEKMGN